MVFNDLACRFVHSFSDLSDFGHSRQVVCLDKRYRYSFQLALSDWRLVQYLVSLGKNYSIQCQTIFDVLPTSMLIGPPQIRVLKYFVNIKSAHY